MSKVDSKSFVQLIMAKWLRIGFNIGSGNGLLPDGTKPLPEPVLTYYQ